jgi:hypothetical protein
VDKRAPGLPASALAFTDRTILWLIGRASEDEVIQAAAQAVPGGAGGQALAELAGLPWSRMHSDFEQKVRAAVAELGFALPTRDSAECRLLGLAALSQRCLAGELTPKELATWAHLAFDWPDVPPAAAALEELYYAYDEDVDVTEDQADRQVREAAARLIHTLR